MLFPFSINDEIKAWQKLGKPRDLLEWEMYPSMVNAYFNPPANEVCAYCGLMVWASDWFV